MPIAVPHAHRHFDLIAFDWDGTLFDSTALIVRCIQAACRDLGLPEPDSRQAAYVIGMGLHEALQHAAPGLAAECYPELGRRYRHHYFARQHEVQLFDGTLPMLRDLQQRGHRLAVATGKSRRGLDEALSGTALHGVFDASRTADETASKPDPQMLFELMAQTGAAPARTLMIGDTTHDLQMARNAQVAAVAVSFGAHDSAAFAPWAPLYVAHNTHQLHDWLRAHG